MAYAMHETHTFQPFGRNRYAIVHPCSKRAFLGASFVDSLYTMPALCATWERTFLVMLIAPPD
jgi:hypothetical protein